MHGLTQISGLLTKRHIPLALGQTLFCPEPVSSVQGATFDWLPDFWHGSQPTTLAAAIRYRDGILQLLATKSEYAAFIKLICRYQDLRGQTRREFLVSRLLLHDEPCAPITDGRFLYAISFSYAIEWRTYVLEKVFTFIPAPKGYRPNLLGYRMDGFDLRPPISYPRLVSQGWYITVTRSHTFFYAVDLNLHLRQYWAPVSALFFGDGYFAGLTFSRKERRPRAYLYRMPCLGWTAEAWYARYAAEDVCLQPVWRRERSESLEPYAELGYRGDIVRPFVPSFCRVGDSTVLVFSSGDRAEAPRRYLVHLDMEGRTLYAYCID